MAAVHHATAAAAAATVVADAADAEGRPLVAALTGVRALAAGWVVAYHLWLVAGRPSLRDPWLGLDATPLVAVGWLGVDLFFVLSGFVLTWQVLRDRERGRDPFAPATFWRDARAFVARRMLRVYPAYLACLTVLLALAALGRYGPWPTWPDIALHVALFHNLVARYVDSINGVFWSMPFEWQFYLVFPLLVLTLLRGRAAWLVLAALAVAGGAKLVSLLAGPGAEIAQLPWRLDVFVAGMIGALIAVRRPPPPRIGRALVLLALASLALGAYYLGWRRFEWWSQDAVPFVRAAWIDVTVAALLVGLCAANGGVARVFALPLVVWLGTISYSVYLWHLPLLHWARVSFGAVLAPPLLLLATLALVVAVSAASYRYVERPFHAPRHAWSVRARLRWIVAWGAALLVAAAVVGGVRAG